MKLAFHFVALLGATHGQAPTYLPCTNFGDLQAWLDPVNAQCCDSPGEDCSSGLPSTCDEQCARVLLPFQASCDAFLALPMNSAMKMLINSAAAKCGGQVVPSPCQPNPCQNGGWCTAMNASQTPTGSGHRRAQSPLTFRCVCPDGFDGIECRDSNMPPAAYHPPPPPSRPETMYNDTRLCTCDRNPQTKLEVIASCMCDAPPTPTNYTGGCTLQAADSTGYLASATGYVGFWKMGDRARLLLTTTADVPLIEDQHVHLEEYHDLRDVHRKRVFYSNVNGQTNCQVDGERWEEMEWPWSSSLRYSHSACPTTSQHHMLRQCEDVYDGFFHLRALGSDPIPLRYYFRHGAWPPILLRMTGNVHVKQLPGGVTFNVEMTVRRSNSNPTLTDADFTADPDWHCTDRDCRCIFPFTYGGTQYNACTEEANDEPWCATRIDTRTNEASAWSECRNCRMTLPDPACSVCPTSCSSGFLVTAFGNEEMNGEPMLTTCSPNSDASSINFPDLQSMSALLQSPRTMFFSVRWSGRVIFSGQTGASFVFTASTDDGSRLTVDGREILNHWDECCATWISEPVRDLAQVVGGQGKDLVFEMHQGAGAAYASLSWQQQ